LKDKDKMFTLGKKDLNWSEANSLSRIPVLKQGS